ncbi:hypothetical protein BJY24_000001, partial [Nocardia transvalensis]|nr:hypothetical protein [Nocardia transvalensis]
MPIPSSDDAAERAGVVDSDRAAEPDERDPEREAQTL